MSSGMAGNNTKIILNNTKMAIIVMATTKIQSPSIKGPQNNFTQELLGRYQINLPIFKFVV